jgi:shikimate kinase
MAGTHGHAHFWDLDDLALRRLGAASVAEVFRSNDWGGEPRWRAAEAEALEAFFEAPLEPSVLALGGGAPMTAAVEALLRGNAHRATVVLLECPASLAAERLARDPGDRTSLTGRGLLEELEALAAARRERYRTLAHLVIDVAAGGAPPPEAIADRIVASLAALRSGPAA